MPFGKPVANPSDLRLDDVVPAAVVLPPFDPCPLLEVAGIEAECDNPGDLQPLVNTTAEHLLENVFDRIDPGGEQLEKRLQRPLAVARVDIAVAIDVDIDRMAQARFRQHPLDPAHHALDVLRGIPAQCDSRHCSLPPP